MAAAAGTRPVAAVVGAGIVGLSAARAFRDDGFRVVVHEQHRVGTPLGASSGRSRIYRTSYRRAEYVRLARRAIDEWQRLDAALLRPTGLLEHGDGVEENAAALDACGEPFRWLDGPGAERLFPGARFGGPVLHTADAGATLADDALRLLAEGVEIREGSRVDDPSSLAADVVCLCAGSWLDRLVDLPLRPQLEQVAYFAGAPDGAPSVIDHGRAGGPVFYGLIAPGVGYKVGQDAAADEPFDPDRPDRPVSPEATARAERYVAEAFPGLEPRALAAESCIYTMSPDSDFFLDVVDGMVVCGGDSGHAFKFGPLLGRLCADLAQGRPLPPEAALFRVDRPLGSGGTRPPAPSSV